MGRRLKNQCKTPLFSGGEIFALELLVIHQSPLVTDYDAVAGLLGSTNQCPLSLHNRSTRRSSADIQI
jgi:hypothetical protein